MYVCMYVRRKSRRGRSSNFYSRKKAPISLDTSTVINLSNVQLTDDEIRLLSRGLTFGPTPRHIDWAQVKADGRRLQLREYFHAEDKTDNLKPNPVRSKVVGVLLQTAIHSSISA